MILVAAAWIASLLIVYYVGLTIGAGRKARWFDRQARRMTNVTMPIRIDQYSDKIEQSKRSDPPRS